MFGTALPEKRLQLVKLQGCGTASPSPSINKLSFPDAVSAATTAASPAAAVVAPPKMSKKLTEVPLFMDAAQNVVKHAPAAKPAVMDSAKRSALKSVFIHKSGGGGVKAAPAEDEECADPGITSHAADVDDDARDDYGDHDEEQGVFEERVDTPPAAGAPPEPPAPPPSKKKRKKSRKRKKHHHHHKHRRSKSRSFEVRAGCFTGLKGLESRGVSCCPVQKENSEMLSSIHLHTLQRHLWVVRN